MNAVGLTQAVLLAPVPDQTGGQAGGRGATALASEVKNGPLGAKGSGSPAAAEEEEGGGSGQKRAAVATSDRQVKAVRQLARLFNRSLSFDINRELDRVVISVIEKDTGRIIRKIPPEEMLRVMQRLREVRGLILDAEG